MRALTKLLCFTCVFPLLLSACGGGSSSDRPESINTPIDTNTTSSDEVFVYQNSVIAEKVLTCSKLFLYSKSCDVAEIKPIGSINAGDVTLEDIKKRLVISHTWMADSFIAALEKINDQELLNLFKPINTIVISYDLRPSFYHSFTASMYIDPRYLWRNSEEWETIYEQDDFRDAYQTEFKFDAFRRYVNPITNERIYYSNTYNANTYNTRTSTQIAPSLFRLLTHELAHANDYLPPELLSSIGDVGTIFDDYISLNDIVSDELFSSIPLTSELLMEAASIAYRGEEMTNRVRNTSALEAGIQFDGDGAADFYGYSTTREDLAMLFENYMMYKKYGAVHDVAFLAIPSNENPSCNDYKVKWGQRNRLADSLVKQRAILVSSRILSRDITPDLRSIEPAPVYLDTNVGWCSSQYMTNAVNFDRENSVSSRKIQQVNDDYLDDRLRE